MHGTRLRMTRAHRRVLGTLGALCATAVTVAALAWFGGPPRRTSTTPAPATRYTVPSSTAAPSTAAPSTAAPSTAAPSTAAPSTAAPSTAAPSTAGPSTAVPSTAAPSTAGPAAARLPGPPHAVATTTIDIVKPSPGPGLPGADLPTEVWYPAVSRGAGLVPATRGAPYPLLVFSQGFDISVEAYAALLEHWASAGFVVAAPTYPHTSPSGPSGTSDLDEADIVNHPADLSYVIAKVLSAAAQPAGPLAGLVDPNEIGLAGHSDGGDVSLAVAADTCCRDPLVKAVAVLSGAELTSFEGRYFTVPNVPILVVQGNADTVNVPACSAQIYDEASPPKYYLDLLGAAHAPPYIQAGAYRQVVARVTTDFFEATLLGDSGARSAMATSGDVGGTAHLSTGPSAPPAPGTCPGAPD